MKKIDWEANLENVANEAARNQGIETIIHYLAERGIMSLENVNPSEYDSLFDDLYYMANDS